MEKPQYFVIGILAVAIGFFALRFTSDEPADYDSSYDGGDEYAMAGGDDYEGGSYGPGSRFGRGGDRAGSGRELGAGGGRASRFGPAGGSGRGGSAGRSGSADSISAGSRERGGRIGSAVGGHGGPRVAQEVGRARSGSISNTTHRDRPSMGSTTQADRVEMLTGKDAGIDPFYDEGNGLDDNPEDDVVLEVNDKEDVDRKADVLEGVEEGDEAGWIDFTEDSVTTFPNFGNANPNSGTITLDIKPNWNGADVTDNSLLQIREPHQWENRMQLVKNGQFLRFIVTDDTGHEADISFKINQWVEGDAHNVTATWEPIGDEGGGQTTLYVDGKQVGTNRFPGKLVFKDTTPMHLGSDYTNGGSYSGANGQFRNFKVLDEAKSPDQLG